MTKLHNTTFIAEVQVAPALEQVLKEVFAPALVQQKGVQDVKLLNIGSPQGEETQSLALQFIVTKDDDLCQLEQNVLGQMFARLQELFGQKVLHFSTDMELLSWHKA